MDNKMIGIIAVAAVAIIVVAGCVIMFTGGSSDDDKYVYYYGNGGTSELGDPYKNPDTVVLGTNLFTRDGYECTGYNDKKDGSGTNYSEGANVMLGTKLYAQWESLSTPKLIVQSVNKFSDILTFSLDPSGTNIDAANQYNLNSDRAIRVSPVGGTAAVGVTQDGIITMNIGDGNLYKIIVTMDNASYSVSGSDAIINFTYTPGVNPTFSYTLAQIVPN